MNNLVLREAEAKDILLLKKLYLDMYSHLGTFSMPYPLEEDALEDVLKILIKAKNTTIILGELEGESVGYIVTEVAKIDRKLKLEPTNIIGFIKELYLVPDKRGMGLAKHFLQKGEEILSEIGASAIECNVIVDNYDAVNFWESNGYHKIAHIMYKRIKN